MVFRRFSVVLVGSRWFSIFLSGSFGSERFSVVLELVVVVCSQLFFMVVVGSQWFQ